MMPSLVIDALGLFRTIMPTDIPTFFMQVIFKTAE
jgi:hypothetical protein